ncbi:MAG: hypothetical protein KGJ73_10785 [Rhodospirillales bacterium]|nr:hypothetical protein [Rhodospirillales bacterium]
MSETVRVLLVDPDVLVRHSVAEYLRGCGYSVAEGANLEEARKLVSGGLAVDILFSRGQLGFELSQWAREAHPEIEVVLCGSVATVAAKASALCEEGPEDEPPFDHQFLLAQIKRLMARRSAGG